MLLEFSKILNDKFPFLKGSKLLLAVSGGLDSVVLTQLFKKLEYDISIAHCNFQLRGIESDLDDHFVNQLGISLEIPVYTKRFDTEKYASEHKTSIQLAAREQRYRWFQEVLTLHNLDYIITAHHADDNLETVLINLTRGTGLDGLLGIPAVNDNIVRPMLDFSRETIFDYASTAQIVWREDKSNAETKYQRNKIRHRVIPILKELNPKVLNNVINTQNHLKEARQIIRDRMATVAEKALITEGDLIKINILEIKKLQHPKAYLYPLLKDYGFTEWNDVIQLLDAQSGKLITTKSHTLLKDRDFLLLLPSDKFAATENQEIKIDSSLSEIKTPVNLLFKNVQKTTSLDKNSIYVDKNLLNYPLTLRKWRQGDLFYPVGIKGKKKLSKYFKDEKLSIIEKQQVWLLCSGNNEIIWVLGKRQDRRFKASNKTTDIMQISIYQPL
jgi:tRNA(Ile)-lysidine synthase